MFILVAIIGFSWLSVVDMFGLVHVCSAICLILVAQSRCQLALDVIITFQCGTGIQLNHVVLSHAGCQEITILRMALFVWLYVASMINLVLV